MTTAALCVNLESKQSLLDVTRTLLTFSSSLLIGLSYTPVKRLSSSSFLPSFFFFLSFLFLFFVLRLSSSPDCVDFICGRFSRLIGVKWKKNKTKKTEEKKKEKKN